MINYYIREFMVLSLLASYAMHKVFHKISNCISASKNSSTVTFFQLSHKPPSLFYFIFILGTHVGTDVMVLRLFIVILFLFKFCDGIQNFIPNMWQAVFANIFM